MKVAPTRADHRTALVLGAGGIVGFSYITGALAALEEVAGFDARQAELVVGTSAGAVMASLLRAGVPASLLYRLGQGESLPVGAFALGAVQPQVDQALTRTFGDPVSFVRRGLGSAVVLARAFGRVPPMSTSRICRRVFPAGMFTISPLVEALAPVLPLEWPHRPTYICACDLATRERVVFGTPAAPPATLAQAMKASCSIPGFYAPAGIGGREYVDGGLLSTTHLDLAAGYDLVIGVAPMAYDRHSARPSLHPARLAMEIYRRYPSRRLRAEMMAVREAGSRVLLVRPSVFEAHRHGFNLMNPHDRVRVAAKAYKTVSQSLAHGLFASTLADFGYRLPSAADPAAAGPA